MIWRYFLLSFLFATVSFADQQYLKIGVSVDLTGPGKQWGNDMRDAFQFAKEDLKLNQIELIIENDQCDNSKAVSIAKKFIEIDKVDLVLGFTCSNVAIATAPIYARSKIPMLVTCASSPEVTKQPGDIFRTTPSDQLVAKKLAEYVWQQKFHSVAILSNQSDYAQDLKESFLANLEKSKINSVNLDYNPGDNDFRTLLVKLKHAIPEALFLNPIDQGDFLQQLKITRSLHWNIPILAAYHPGSKTFLEEAKELAEGLSYVDFTPLDRILTTDGKQAMNRFYQAGFQVRGLDSVIITAYEALRLIQIANSEKLTIPDLLKSGRKFTGNFGEYSFDAEGDIQGIGFIMKTISKGVPKVLE